MELSKAVLPALHSSSTPPSPNYCGRAVVCRRRRSTTTTSAAAESPPATTLSAKGCVPAGMSASEVHSFLATPSNWPQFVASSHSVRGAVDQPLSVGDSVDEIFGLPPVLPLTVSWTCLQADAKAGILDLRSKDGLSNIASDFRMYFSISEQDSGAVDVDFTMSYVPRSPLAMLATPAVFLDNTLAVQFLLPMVLNPKPKLDQFRELMGVLYGVAGVAHAIDLAGPSQLLTAAGAPVFAALPLPGQLLAVLWSAMGPISYACSRAGGLTADIGLIAYGGVEIGCAALVAMSCSASAEAEIAALPNAIVVQLIIAACWFSQYRATSK